MWRTCVFQLPPLVLVDLHTERCMKDTASQTNNGWLIRCVPSLPLVKVRAEIFEHPTGVYWKGAGMQRMSAVWVCPWMKGAHKMCPRQPMKVSSFQRMYAGNPQLSISLYGLHEIKYPLHVQYEMRIKMFQTDSNLPYPFPTAYYF